MKKKGRGIIVLGFCFLLLAGFSMERAARGEPSSLSGNFISSYVDDNFGKNIGNGTFTISYSFPAQTRVGSNVTGQVSLQVNQLNGLQLYVELYQITVQIALPSGHGTSGTVSGSGPLYPGAIWGPKNVTLPMTEQQLGTISGSANASVSITVGTTILAQVVGQGPANIERVHGDLHVVGNMTISGGSTSNSNGSGGGGGIQSQNGNGFFPYAIVAAGVVVVLFGVFLPRIFPESRPQD